MANMKWKDKLISSSFPLEYEAAKILVKNHFAVDGDYTYTRDDLGTKKDFSVDIHATGYIPYTNDNEVESTMNMLVECKQRKENVNWLFLPDVNRDEMSSFVLGYTLNAVDEFSKYFFKSSSTVALDCSMPLCYKGIEIDTSDGRVYDNEIRHGLYQLQYAMPRVLRENIVHNLYAHEEDNKPFFLCSILLTTAKLFVSNKSLSIEKVKNASKIEDFSKEVPFLSTYLEYGPDFEEHCKEEFQDLKELNLQNDDVRSVAKHRKENGEYDFCLPHFISLSLQNAHAGELRKYFTQVIVCNMDSFPQLIKEIKKISSVATKGKKTYKH